MDVALFGQAVGEFGAKLSRVTDGQWGLPTPCSDWDVRALVNHVAGELLWIPPLFEGLTIAEVGSRFDGDVLGEDPMATWQQARGPALAVAGEPGALDRIVHLSFGDTPGSEYLSQITCDLVIHGWDLARAIGADDRMEPALLTFASGYLLPQVDAWRAAGAFAAEVDAGGGVDDQASLLARTGRSPDWPS